ncbi:MAG: hypothetical protein JST46_13190 [Bacteroidetes bacterium]|nr:hypothetical protein [Bacteroidota bacterium]
MKAVRKRLLKKGFIEVLRKGKGRRATLYKIALQGIGVYVGKNTGGILTPSKIPTSEGGELRGVLSPPEVLTSNEVLTNEVLTTEREALASEIQKLIFPNTSKALEKRLRTQAEKILGFYEEGRKVPEVRLNRYNSGYDGYWESLCQLRAYVDFHSLTKKAMVYRPEKVAEFITGQDWCEMLLSWVNQNNFNVLGADLESSWILECFYEPIICYVNKKTGKVEY